MQTKALALGLVLSLSATAAYAGPVMMISIDGLRGIDATQSKARGLKLPNLEALLAEGVYADSVRNVFPTITYPNHVTLITGVNPSEHGVGNNAPHDAKRQNLLNGNYYAIDIKTPTLWGAVHASGGKVASLFWPLSVGARDVDYLIPDIGQLNTAQDIKLVEALSSPGLVAELSANTGVELRDTQVDARGEAEQPESDLARAKLVDALMASKKPLFTTFHVVSTDHFQHYYGPDTPQALATLEAVDGIIGDLVRSVRRSMPDINIAIVSDHGFDAVKQTVSFGKLFVDEGLVTLDPKTGAVTAWEATPTSGGGAVGVLLARPNDKALKARVAAILKKFAANPDYGIAHVHDGKQAAKLGATRDESFWIEMKIGTMAMGSRVTGPVILPPVMKGMHGYSPDLVQMHSTFIMVGPDVPKKGSLGIVDIRDIAPTLAKVMKVSLPTAKGKPLF